MKQTSIDDTKWDNPSYTPRVYIITDNNKLKRTRSLDFVIHTPSAATKVSKHIAMKLFSEQTREHVEIFEDIKYHKESKNRVEAMKYSWVNKMDDMFDMIEPNVITTVMMVRAYNSKYIMEITNNVVAVTYDIV